MSVGSINISLVRPLVSMLLHGMPAGQAVSRFGSAIFFLHGMPAGQAVSRFGSAIFFFSSS